MVNRLVFLTNNNTESGRCRGFDIANYLDMPINIPVSDITSNDIVIMVKKFDPEVCRKSKHTYVDFMDGHDTLESCVLENSKELEDKISILTLDPHGAKLLKKYIFKQFDVTWIPHTHCNDNDVIRPVDREIKTIGYNGSDSGFEEEFWNLFSDNIQKHGFTAIRTNTITTGSDNAKQLCCDFYYNLDIAVAFRPTGGKYVTRWHPEIIYSSVDLKCATKLNNASSFGVPSVAYPEHAFLWNYEKNGTFIPVYSLEEMIKACIYLRENLDSYQFVANKAREESKPYSIENISKLYLNLLERN